MLTKKNAAKLAAWRERVETHADAIAERRWQRTEGYDLKAITVANAAAAEAENDMDRLFKDLARLLETP